MRLLSSERSDFFDLLGYFLIVTLLCYTHE